MANKAKKSADESALDAVEKALSIDFNDDEIGNPKKSDIEDLERSLAETAEQLRDEGNLSKFDDEGENTEGTATSENSVTEDFPETPPTPANDEHSEELNNLLYAIQQKPASRIFLWTFIASLVWLGACIYYAYSAVLPRIEEPVSTQSLFGSLEFSALVAIALVPLLPLWGFAVMLRRAHEMRHAAGSMIQAALRLLQPEKVSADSVATVGTAIRREMTAIGDGVERAIARAGELEFMVQKEVMNLERSYGDSEVRLRRLLDDIGTEREEVITHAEKLRNSITESQSGLTTEIDVASARIDEKIKDAASLLNETLDTQSMTITSRLKETSDGLIEILSRTGSEVTTNLDAGTENLKTSVTERIREMSEVISTSGQAVATLIDGRTASFETTANDLNEKLETGKKAFEIAFGERSEELTKIMSTAGQSVSSILKLTSSELAEQGNGMVMDLEDNRKKLEEALDKQSRQFSQLTNLASDNLASAIDAGSERFEESASKAAQQLEDNLTMRATDFESRVSENANSLENSLTENLNKIDSTLSSKGDNLVNALGMRTEALGKVLQERSETIGQTIAERLSGFGKSLTGHVDDAVIRLKEQTDALQENTKSAENVIVKRAQSVEETIKTSTIEFATGLKESLKDTAEKSAELNQALETTASNLATSVEQSAQKLTSSIETGADQILGSINAGQQSISQIMKEADDAIGARFADSNEQMSASLHKQKDELEATLSQNTKNLQDALNERANNLSSKLNQGIHRLSSAISANGNEAAEELERNVEALEKRLQENSNSIEKQFAAGSVIIQENLDLGRDKLLEAISTTVSNAGSAIDSKAEKLSQLLSERAALINSTLGKSLVDTQRELEEKTNDINNLLSDRTEQISSQLSARTEQISSQLSERTQEINTTLSERSQEINATLSQQSREINTQLSERSQEIGTTLSQRAEEINSVLSHRSAELSEIIERDAKPIVDSIEATGEAINNRLASMSKVVADEANALFANLTTSNEQLENLINSATSNLSLMQSSLGEQSSGFANAVATSKAELEESNRIASDVEERLQSASNNLLQNMGSIANRLEAQGATLQDVTRLIDAAQTNLNETLDSKQQSLQDLASGLVLRSDEINNSVSSFAQMISGMIEDIHSRTKGTGGEIAAEVSAAIDDATARFGDSVDAMRSAAATIRNELEETRDQMRRGVLELPDETAQNAAAMRRVVTDQIAALKDLSSIVERSGKVLDSSVSAPARTTAVGLTEGQLPQASTTQSSQSVRPVQFPPDTQSKLPEPAFDSTLRGTRQVFGTESQAGATLSNPRQPAVRERESTGWVSDLLKRASSEEPRTRPAPTPLPDPRSPDQFVESLNSLSMDIASAIDHEASVDLWERYQRGETNVFTRRLYTLQGQHTFDEIRNKYSRDREFRNAVDRYIDDFERLLGDVSKNDRGGTMAQNYLTSDTGKVYTMLAHAAGRFGN